MRLGINSYTYMWSIGFEGAYPRKPLSALDLLAKARELDVQLVQTGPNLRMGDRELHEFIIQANQSGIELEFGIRGLDLLELKEWISKCRAANARLLRTVPEINGQPPTTDQLVKLLNEVVPYLVDYQVKLGLENGRIPCRDLRAVIERINNPQVGIVLDMVNSLAIPEGWKEVTRVLAPYTMCLHYKDFHITRQWHMMGFSCEGQPAGKGQLEPDWLFEVLSQSKYDFNVILELWTPEHNNIEETIRTENSWAKESINFLRQFVNP